MQAKALDKDKISPPHALKIAALLGKMHAFNLSVPELTAPTFDVHSQDTIRSLTLQAVQSNWPFAEALQRCEQDLLACNEGYQQTIPLLKNTPW